jgi:spore cortex formation protein SpoVR/YcgB (stage V sporulation)
MEGNSALMQTLVIAHAAYGHNHFFKNNYLFKQWTSADSIIDYMQFAKDYINRMEEEHGPDTVEDLLNALHSVQGFGIDRYKRPTKINKQQEKERQKQRAEYVQTQANLLWSTLPQHIQDRESAGTNEKEKIFPSEPQENLLYFIEKHSPILEPWQREIVRIIRKVSQYYYPQMQTKLMNEGFASFVHYYIMNRLWETDQISNGQALEFLHSHSSVLTQLTHTSEYYSGFNPYALGFEMFSEIRRVCEHPTEVDREYFPHMVGENWKEVILDAVENYRDESFISQFLTPATVKKWRLFEITNKEQDPFVMVTSIQNRKDFNNVRQTLSRQYSIGQLMPTIEVIDANVQTTRELHLKHTPYDNSELHECSEEVLQYLEQLWGYPVLIK